MKWILYVISIVLIGSGTGMILYTRQYREMLGKLTATIHRKIFAALAFVVGVLLVVAAPSSRNLWVVVAIGIIAMAKGLFLYLNPRNLVDCLMDWYLNRVSDQAFRFFGIIGLILGTAMLSWT